MVPACSGQREHLELRGEDNGIAENLHFHNTLRRFPKKIVPLLRSFGIMPLTLIDEVFYWTVSCLLTKCTWEIDQHMLKNNPEGKYLFGEVCFLSFFAPIALHGTLYGENGLKKSHLERSEQKSSENKPPQK